MRARLALLVFGPLLAVLGVTVLARPAFAQPSAFTILLDDGTIVSAARVEAWPEELVRATLVDGSERFISTSKITSIIDDTGKDRTSDVLSGRRTDGESPSSSSLEAMHGFVFRPRPLPVSKSYFIYNLGLSDRLGNDYSYQNDNTMLSLELGYMRNLTTKNALGFGVIGMMGDQVSKLAVRGRYRRWLTSGLGLDGALGLTVAGGDEYGSGPIFPGGIASVGLQLEGTIGVTLEVEQTRFSNPSNTYPDVQTRIRGELGSGFGVLGTGALLVLGILFLTSGTYD